MDKDENITNPYTKFMDDIKIKIGSAKIEKSDNNNYRITITNNDGQAFYFIGSGNGFVSGKYNDKEINYHSEKE